MICISLMIKDVEHFFSSLIYNSQKLERTQKSLNRGMDTENVVHLHIFRIHFSVDGHLGSFQLLAIISQGAMNIVRHVSLLHILPSSGYMPRSGIAGSSSSTIFNFLRNRQTDFQSGCTSLQSHQKWRSVPLSPHPCQYLLSPELLFLAILTGVK